MTDFEQGLEIVVVGIGGVFAVLLVLMLVLVVIGKIFGKKKPKKTAPGNKTAPKKQTTSNKSKPQGGDRESGAAVGAGAD